ncbi:MAG TPA: histidine phosphatase family protein [Chloroflexota bacterium]|nr:histidine phosphatase family protein [Chloroflexota bacterium]
MAPTHLYLIRHGEAECHLRGIVGGRRGDVGLSALGVRQAEALRDRLANHREIAADLLIASTLPRARQTAEIIAPALDLPIILDDEVRELDPGDADGMRYDEVERTFGTFDIERQFLRPFAPGAESWAQFMVRVATALDRLWYEHRGKSVAVVCHGGVIEGSFVYFFGLGSLSKPPAGFSTANTSITHWEYREAAERMPAQWYLVRYNDAAHLRDACIA